MPKPALLTLAAMLTLSTATIAQNTTQVDTDGVEETAPRKALRVAEFRNARQYRAFQLDLARVQNNLKLLAEKSEELNTARDADPVDDDTIEKLTNEQIALQARLQANNSAMRTKYGWSIHGKYEVVVQQAVLVQLVTPEEFARVRQAEAARAAEAADAAAKAAKDAAAEVERLAGVTTDDVDND